MDESKQKKEYWVYVARCADDTFYTGITTDIERRMREHNAGEGAKYTRNRRPIRCVYMERCDNRSDALRREASIKKLDHVAKSKLASSIRPPEPSTAATHNVMKANKGKNTKPELMVRKRLCEAGLTGYRLHWKVPGKPDIAWPGRKVALFVSGCFWHRCPKCNLPLPKSHKEYWLVKFDANVERDKRNVKTLEDDGWTVHTIWECELKKDAIDETFEKLLPQLAEELGKELKGC